MNRIFFRSVLIFMHLLCLNFAFAQQEHKLVQQIRQAFKDKNSANLKVALAPSFSVAGNTQEGALRYLDHILSSYPAQDVRFLSIKKQDSGHRIAIEISKTDKSTIQTALYTDSADRMLYLDLFDQLYGMNRYQTSRLRAKIPFENHEGTIILSVKINDFKRPLRLLFDTGADGMAVSQQLADEIGLKVTRQNNASVVGGNMQIQVSDNNTIFLDTLKLSGQGIAIFPEMHRETDGIIGNSLVKRFITKVDYDKSELLLYDFGNYQYEQQGHSIPVEMPAGLLIIPGNLEIRPGKSYTGNFVFDTGASYSLICFRPFVRTNKLLVSGFRPEYQGTTASMGMVSPTFTGRSHSFSFSHLPAVPNLPVTLMAGGANNENWKPEFDGSIGVRLISRYNFTINLQNREIYLEPNHLYPYPQDFSIGSYLFGYDSDGTLRLLSLVGAEDEKVKLTTGEAISSINGIAAHSFLKDKTALESILNLEKGTAITIKPQSDTVTESYTINR
ncbi:retropepsin-like aspartic protease [Sphingobacterium spiritivorum]|uniref:retropepsin-like aspartic protease n=1 Tax=Sphingobacterium spiritivorum TaxID=258 RepID=UPI003DA4B19D